MPNCFFILRLRFDAYEPSEKLENEIQNLILDLYDLTEKEKDLIRSFSI